MRIPLRSAFNVSLRFDRHVKRIKTKLSVEMRTDRLLSRFVSSTPFRILDAPGFLDDFYVQTLDWTKDLITIGLDDKCYTYNFDTQKVDETFCTENADITAILRFGDILAIGNTEGVLNFVQNDTETRRIDFSDCEKEFSRLKISQDRVDKQIRPNENTLHQSLTVNGTILSEFRQNPHPVPSFGTQIRSLPAHDSSFRLSESLNYSSFPADRARVDTVVNPLTANIANERLINENFADLPDSAIRNSSEDNRINSSDSGSGRRNESHFSFLSTNETQGGNNSIFSNGVEISAYSGSSRRIEIENNSNSLLENGSENVDYFESTRRNQIENNYNSSHRTAFEGVNHLESIHRHEIGSYFDSSQRNQTENGVHFNSVSGSEMENETELRQIDENSSAHYDRSCIYSNRSHLNTLAPRNSIDLNASLLEDENHHENSHFSSAESNFSQNKVANTLGRISAMDNNGPVLSLGTKSGIILHYDTRMSRACKTINLNSGTICALKWSPDKKHLACGTNDNSIKLIDFRTGTVKHSLEGHNGAVKALSFCPWKINEMVSGGGTNDKKLIVWNTENGKMIRSKVLDSQICTLNYLPMHKEIVASFGYSSNRLSIYKESTLKLVTHFGKHEERVTNCCLNGDKTMLASVSADENLKFWKLCEKNTKTQYEEESYR